MKAKPIVLLACAVFTAAALAPLATTGRGGTAPAASAAPAADELFSRRAMRRARLLLWLRLMELREERLTCVRAAILRRLPPDLSPPTGGPGDSVKHSAAPRASQRRSALAESEDCPWL